MRNRFARLGFPKLVKRRRIRVNCLHANIKGIGSTFCLSRTVGRTRPSLIIGMNATKAVYRRMKSVFMYHRFISHSVRGLIRLNVRRRVSSASLLSRGKCYLR